MRYLPYYIGQFIEFLISMKRIQDFLICDTVNTSITSRRDVR